MQLTTIPFEKTGKFSKLILDYVNNPEKLSDFSKGEVSLQNFKKKLTEKSFSKEKRELLVGQLQSQYESSGVETPSNVSLLLNDTTLTVTTGHQLCLLGGPQYFIHKIVSVIKLSMQLKEAFPESDFVPVFWLASEDHDFDEINDVKLFGKNLKIEKEYKGAVGRLDATIFAETVEKLGSLLGDSDNGNELRELFSVAYSKGSLADATRYWVNELFCELGLVIIDGDDVELKRSFLPVIKNELIERIGGAVIDSSSDKLKELGYNTQVNPREINLFYIENNLRERIVFKGGKYVVLNTEISFSETEIVSLLESNPEKFSPNVVLRPVYEEEILPNLAYVGGPGEIAYWLQLKSNFERLKVDFPLLVVRDSFLIPNTKQLYSFIEMGFELEDIFRDEHELVKEFLKARSEEELHFEKEEALLEELKEVLQDKVKGLDNSLSGMINAEMTKINKLFEKLETRLIKAQKTKEEVSVNKISKFKKAVLPNDKLIERQESFIPNYLKYGSEYLGWLIDYSNVFDSQLKVLVVE